MSSDSDTPILSVRNLTVCFDEFVAVDDLSFDLFEGQTLALVGESGSGKSVTALSIMRLAETSSRARISRGGIWLRRSDASVIDLVQADETTMRAVRGNEISMIFQEPLTSLNPVYTAGEQVAEAIRAHQNLNRAAARERALEMFRRVRIPRPEKALASYPHQMSGGMRQRVMIAMALSCSPAILVADEPTTALDVTIQAQILGLMRELQQAIGAAIMLITHDMGVVAEVADNVVVMRRAQRIETGSVYDVFEHPQSAYTKGLLSSIPRLGSMVGETQPKPFDLVDANEGR